MLSARIKSSGQMRGDIPPSLSGWGRQMGDYMFGKKNLEDGNGHVESGHIAIEIGPGDGHESRARVVRILSFVLGVVVLGVIGYQYLNKGVISLPGKAKRALVPIETEVKDKSEEVEFAAVSDQRSAKGNDPTLQVLLASGVPPTEGSKLEGNQDDGVAVSDISRPQKPSIETEKGSVVGAAVTEAAISSKSKEVVVQVQEERTSAPVRMHDPTIERPKKSAPPKQTVSKRQESRHSSRMITLANDPEDAARGERIF